MSPRYDTVCLLCGLLALAIIGCTRTELECRDDLGCMLIRPGEPVRIAFMLSLSGETAFMGEDSQGGIEMAVDDQAGNLLEHPIELVAIDSGCSQAQGEAAAQRVAADTDIVGIIGPSCSDVARALVPAVEQAGLVMISPSTTAPELTEMGQSAYFRTAHNNLLQARIAAQYAYSVLGARRAAVVHDESIYAEGLQQHFADVFQNLGGSVVFQGSIGSGQAGVAESLTTIAASSPDVLYLPVFEPEGLLIASGLAEVEGLENMTLIGADSLLAPTFAISGGDAVNGMYLSGPVVVGSAYEDFLNKWLARYGSAPPGPFHAHAYDATRILLKAVEAVAQVGNNGGLLIGRRALRRAVAATTELEGLTGTLACRPSGECASGEALALFQLTGEEISGEKWPPPVVWMP